MAKQKKEKNKKKDTKATAKDTYISINTNERKPNQTKQMYLNVKCILNECTSKQWALHRIVKEKKKFHTDWTRINCCCPKILCMVCSIITFPFWTVGVFFFRTKKVTNKLIGTYINSAFEPIFNLNINGYLCSMIWFSTTCIRPDTKTKQNQTKKKDGKNEN